MELIKKTDNYTIYKKKSGRYAVKNKEKKYLSDKEKVEILLEEKLIKLSPRKKPEEPAAEAAAEEAAEEAAEAAAEELLLKNLLLKLLLLLRSCTCC